ncbi:hypothetical protein F4808DRAFT_50022 [Astrocystis sublimbata]|nr:hypothetical protein F4808DRAFT_50022 [Astrocystis sublimbata]
MANMASDEPQSRQEDAKAADIAPTDDMDLDEPATNSDGRNGDVKSGDSAQTEAAPVTNGDTVATPKSDDAVEKTNAQETNDDASTSVADLPNTRPDVPELATEDKEMSGVNAAAEDEENAPDKKAEDVVTPDVSSQNTHAEAPSDAASKAPGTSVSPDEPELKSKPSSAEGLTQSANVDADAMDIDPSADHSDLKSSADHGNSTQDTSAASDPPVDSSLGSSQLADLSKLEIKATQEKDESTENSKSTIEAPETPSKVSRSREEDDVDEPAAKRTKTDNEDEVMADSPLVAGQEKGDQNEAQSTQGQGNGSLESAIPDSLPIAIHQNKRIREVLGNVKKTKSGANFRKSVQELWPLLWNEYAAKIDNPIDISSMEVKLREDKYTTYGDFKADVLQLHQNAVLFNGETHEVSQSAAQVRDYILVRMPDIIHMKAPAKPEKSKPQPTRHAEPRAATQPRRQSQSQAPPPASSPKLKPEASTSTPSQAFAVPPSGIPQIRRDSTRDDRDRPKRPIHPPKNRDPDYLKGSRKKKLDPEQRFFDMVLEEIKKARHYSINQWFLTAVDPVALNIPNYFKIIKKPMDLATMTERNNAGDYKTTKDVEKDMKLIVHNSEIFNGAEHEVTNQARQLEQLLITQLGGKDRWMERHYPAVAPSANHGSAASPERSVAESDDQSEGDGEDEDNDAIQGLQKRLNEEQDKLNQCLNSKKPDLMMMEVQQSMVTFLQRKLVEERTKFLSEKKPKKKKGGSSKSKSKTGGGGLGGNKKVSGAVSTSKKPHNSSKKPPVPKKRSVGQLEKAVISDGINELDGPTLVRAVEIIKRDTGQNENDEGEMELDIDSLTPDALVKLHDLINKAHPHIRQKLVEKEKLENSSAMSSEPEVKAKPNSASKAKKNKPMNKHEQERKIEQLRELKAQLQRHGSGSQEPMPEAETQPLADSSESSDSEEE